MPRVFVMDLNAFDYSPAEQYGELTVIKSAPLHTGTVDPDSNDEAILQIYRQMAGYKGGTDYIINPEGARYIAGSDFLIPTGKPVKMCTIAGIAFRYFGPEHQFLVWDAKYYRYVPYTIDVSCVDEFIKESKNG